MYLCRAKSLKKMTYRYILILLDLLFSVVATAQTFHVLSMPHQEQLSSKKVLFIMQDSEGALWYATEGGGICRDDGCSVDIFRNDITHPQLLGSNNVACLAEAKGHIIIGTYHGAYVLNKKDHAISRLKEVDDNRVDDILVTSKGHILMTANRKIYEFSTDLKLTNTYPSRWKGQDVYVSDIFEDRSGHIWAAQWNGGLLRLEKGAFKEMPWPVNATPTAMADNPLTNGLWIGTVGQGIVKYDPTGKADIQEQTAGAICIDLQLSADGRRLWMTTINALTLYSIGDALTTIPTTDLVPQGNTVLNRLTLDHQGRLLVAGSEPGPFAIEETTRGTIRWDDATIRDGQRQWAFLERQGLVMTDDEGEHTINTHSMLLPTMTKRMDGGVWATDGQRLMACTKDSVIDWCKLSARPMAMTDDGKGCLWISTGNDIRRLPIDTRKEETVNSLEDVSAMTFTSDGTLWMASIYGKMFRYKDGKLAADDYITNEHGDGVTALTTDSAGRVIIVSDRYIRRYDPKRNTLAQQCREDDGVYRIELQETKPGDYWSSFKPQEPKEDPINRGLYIGALLLCVVVAAGAMLYLRNHKKAETNAEPQHPDTATDATTVQETEEQTDEETTDENGEFLKLATRQVEAHLADEAYSVELLSKDLCMSRMTFYRKIQNATGQKPTEFMRTIRLEHAAKLLSEGRMTVSEISYATGFSSVSYFSRCFRSKYGVPPTQYN